MTTLDMQEAECPPIDDPGLDILRHLHAASSLDELERLMVSSLAPLLPHRAVVLFRQEISGMEVAAYGGETSFDWEHKEVLNRLAPSFADMDRIAVVTAEGPSTGLTAECEAALSKLLCGGLGEAWLALPLVHAKVCRAVVLFLIGPGQLPSAQELEPFARQAPLLASALLREQILQRCPQARRWEKRSHGQVRQSLLSTPKRKLLALLLAAAILLFPLPFEIGGDVLLAPMREHFAYASIAGEILEVYVAEGDQVQVSQVLARLDGRDLEFEIRRKQRETTRIQAELMLLRNQGALDSEKALELELAKIDLERKKEDLRYLTERRAELLVRAPVAGLILSENLDRMVGRKFQPGESFCSIAPAGETDVVLDIDESEISWIHPGQAMQVRFRAWPGKTLDLDVERISPMAEVSTKGGNHFNVRARFRNEIPGLRPGMGGQGRVRIGWRPTAWLLLRKLWILCRRPLML